MEAENGKAAAMAEHLLTVVPAFVQLALLTGSEKGHSTGNMAQYCYIADPLEQGFHP